MRQIHVIGTRGTRRIREGLRWGKCSFVRGIGKGKGNLGKLGKRDGGSAGIVIVIHFAHFVFGINSRMTRNTKYVLSLADGRMS